MSYLGVVIRAGKNIAYQNVSLSRRSVQAFINFCLTRTVRRPLQCSDCIRKVEVKRSVLRSAVVVEVLYAISFSWFLQARWGVVFQQMTMDRLRSCSSLVQLTECR